MLSTITALWLHTIPRRLKYHLEILVNDLKCYVWRKKSIARDWNGHVTCIVHDFKKENKCLETDRPTLVLPILFWKFVNKLLGSKIEIG